MSRTSDFAAQAAAFPGGAEFLTDMTPITGANPNGYLSAAGDCGPWIRLKGGEAFIHVEALGGDATSNVVVAIDITNNPNNGQTYKTAQLTEGLTSGAPAGDGLTVCTRGLARVRLVSTSGTPARVVATVSR